MATLVIRGLKSRLLITRGLASSGSPPVVALDIRAAIVSLLKADATIASLVGASVVPLKRPQLMALPMIEYSLVSNPRGHHLVSASGVNLARFQFDCWSQDLSQCVAIKAAVEGCLDNYTGTVSGREILRIRQVMEHDLHEWATDGSDRDTYRISLDYYVKHRVSIPTP